MMYFFKKIFITVIGGIVIIVFAIFAINFYINSQNDFKFLEEKIPISGDSEKSLDKERDIKENKENKSESLNNLDNIKEKIELESENKEEVIEEKDVLFDVPFTSQAPFGNWSDPKKQDGCEEAVAIMAVAWARGENLTPKIADGEISKISEFELSEYGHFHDTSANDTAERIFKEYLKYDNIEIRYDIGKNDIKRELYKGNIVIVPTNGQLLGNPYYTPPGPTTHMLVVKGYDVGTKEFITNDPGTRRGESFRYNEDVLEKALFDYPTGSHEKVEEIRTAMIIVRK